MAEEAYERMVNPEIFGGEKYRPSGHAGGFRGRLQRGQHYEQVRRELPKRGYQEMQAC